MKNKRTGIIYYINFLLVIALLVSCLSLFCIPVSAEYKGSCGEKLTWKLNAGTLTISGSGEMTNFEGPEMSPWYEYREQILRVVLPEKMTSIGNLAFYECKNLVAVVIPDSVKTIGHYSFAECENMCLVDLGTGINSIGRSAFYNCRSVDYIKLPVGLESIGDQAFYRCESIAAISIPQYVTQFGMAVFAYCKSLVTVEIKSPLTVIPEWTFYGCDRLISVQIPESVTTIDNYAFKGCEDISNVYYSGNDSKKEKIKQEIAADVPLFKDFGMVIHGDIVNNAVVSSKFTENIEDDLLISNNIILTYENDVEVKNIVENVVPIPPFPDDSQPEQDMQEERGKYTADIYLTIANEDMWEDATNEIVDALKYINNTYSKTSNLQKLTVTVYILEGEMNEKFLTELTGRSLILNIIMADGSAWKIDCSGIKQNSVIHDSNYSYDIKEGSKDNKNELGTDKCYQLEFNESAYINAQVIVKLPASETANTNAFLYQIEKDGSYTRLQAVQVGDSGNVNLYLGAVDNKTQYVIGIDVPNEKTDDIIIPDEILLNNSAIERLEKIDYVITGIDSSWGMNMRTVTIIMIAVLVGCAAIVGVIMFVMNKKKLKKMQVNYKVDK